MIEFVDFGAGFRVDGPDWGASARPYLEHAWRPLSPGVHDLQAEQNFIFLHQISVLHDGRGVLAIVPRPEFGRMMGLSRDTVASGTGRIIDGAYNFAALTNTRYSEVVVPDLAIAQHALRATGMVRYNPGEY